MKNYVNLGEFFLIKLKDLLVEGVYDKGILKAVLWLRRAGSSKSYVIHNYSVYRKKY